ncbi:hyaluronan and proteoglycan link protein 3 [Lingula anatina]|uniref:Hyaluronan and proteoglycan link protein 3 n=1 Tax=Lingula anatina TaxID=7574 RepID=A0A1S3H3M4_LINAN|nr:hyaluronan and proteoglycan link protein 3 [Lingula anatina]|eukprot:XP_013380562.1 hyaluronan and proteoglycan link protein 3 [Lingula anatina]
MAYGVVGDRQLLGRQETYIKTLTGLVTDQGKLLAAQIQKLDDEKKLLESLKRDPTHCTRAGVFHAQSPSGGYQLTFEDAKQLCAKYGAAIATHAQLTAAWNDGLDVCACGWLADGDAGYPIHKARPGCLSYAGIHSGSNSWCKQSLIAKTGRADVYCFKQ